jgi:PAS domain S-box-containing protein
MAYAREVLVTQKPSYEELEQRIRALEAEAVERKAMEQALRESEEKYRMVVERANEGIAIIQDGLLKYVNPRMAEMTGYTIEEGLDTPFTNYVDPKEVPEAKEDYNRRIAGEQLPRKYERGLRHKNGSRIDTEISGGLITYRGKPADFVVVREITERKRVERENLKTKAMLQSVFDGILDPLIMLHRDMTVMMLNRAAIRYYRIKPRDVIGKVCHKAFQRGSKTCEGCKIPSAVLRGRPVTFERKGLMDSDRLEQVVLYPVKDVDGKVEAAIIHISDITEARFMEQQLIRSEKLASLGLLVSGVAHEINNPLAIIHETAGLMKDYIEFSKEFEHRDKFLHLLDSVFNSVDRARGIIRRFLGFVRHKDVKTEAIDLNRLLKDVLGFLEKEAFHRSINVHLDFSQDLPALESDKGQLQQVFLNIIKNAFEVVDDMGNISIATGVKNARTLQVKIADDGHGMSPEQVKHLFKPFHTSGKEGGTGLGLYITHEIITKNLRGRVTVQSQEGKGTTFTVELPIERNEATQ